MFQGRRQLIVQHFMFDPAWDEGCPVCSYPADSVGNLAHLHARDTTFAAAYRAPTGKIDPFRKRIRLVVPVVLVPGQRLQLRRPRHPDEDVTPTEWNFVTKQELIDADLPYFAGPNVAAPEPASRPGGRRSGERSQVGANPPGGRGGYARARPMRWRFFSSEPGGDSD